MNNETVVPESDEPNTLETRAPYQAPKLEFHTWVAVTGLSI